MRNHAHGAISRRGFLAASCTATLLSRRGIAQDEMPWKGEPLPLFPLAMVAFPGERVPLHIFEPRYKQLLIECRDDEITFGISPYLDGRISGYGTEMRLAKVLRENDAGDMDVVVEGIRVYLAIEHRPKFPDKPYPGAGVIFLENDSASDAAKEAALLSQYRKLCRAWERDAVRIDRERGNVSFQLGHLVGLSMEQKVELLKELSETARQKIIRKHIAKLLRRRKVGGTVT